LCDQDALVLVGLRMQDLKSLPVYAAVTICATLVNIQTDNILTS